MPKRRSGNPAKAFTQIPKVQGQHPEAFHLMKYRADHRQLEEYIWNSRDGVTPFVITMRDGTPGTHVDWRGDVYAPDHKPAVGERIFVDLSDERAALIAQANAEAIWERPRDTDVSYSARDEFESVEQLTAYLLEGLVSEIARSAPDLIEVTEEYAGDRGWPTVPRDSERLQRVLDLQRVVGGA